VSLLAAAMLAQDRRLASETLHLDVEEAQTAPMVSQESRNKIVYFLHGAGLAFACVFLLVASNAVWQVSHEKSPSNSAQTSNLGFSPVGISSARGVRATSMGGRTGVITNSHFTKVATEIKDEPMLKETLIQMGFEVKVKKEVPQQLNMELVADQEFWTNEMTVTSLDGQKVLADVIAVQDNAKGQHIAFKNVDGAFQILTDTDGWKQSVPLEVWKDRLNQAYAINVVKDSARNVGFDVESLKQTNEGVVELVMERYAVGV
jgi:hypothetical protein